MSTNHFGDSPTNKSLPTNLGSIPPKTPKAPEKRRRKKKKTGGGGEVGKKKEEKQQQKKTRRAEQPNRASPAARSRRTRRRWCECRPPSPRTFRLASGGNVAHGPKAGSGELDEFLRNGGTPRYLADLTSLIEMLGNPAWWPVGTGSTGPSQGSKEKEGGKLLCRYVFITGVWSKWAVPVLFLLKTNIRKRCCLQKERHP